MTVWNVEQCVLPMDLYFRVLQNNREHSRLLGWTWLDPATCRHKMELYKYKMYSFFSRSLVALRALFSYRATTLLTCLLLHISTVRGVQIVLRDLEGLPEIRDLRDHTHTCKWGGQDQNGWLWGVLLLLCERQRHQFTHFSLYSCNAQSWSAGVSLISLIQDHSQLQSARCGDV